MKIQSSDRLYAPCLYLYAFQLADRSQKPEDHIIYQQCENLLQNFKSPADTRNNPHSPQGNSSNTLHFSYNMTAQKSDRRFSGKITVNQDEYPVWGSAHNQQIYDSYSLWFNLHIPERAAGSGKLLEFPVEGLQSFNQNEQLIIDPKTDKFLGQTLVLTVLLTDEQKLPGKGIGIGKPDRDYLKSLSNNCINALFADSDIKPPFNRDGELFNSPIFEYGLTSDCDCSSDRHVLIWFWQDKQTEQTYARCQNKLVDLFFYRHKIIAAYRQSQSIHESIAENDLKIQQQINHFQLVAKNNSLPGQALEQFQTQLISLPKLALDSSQALRSLEAAHNAIAIHTHHYNETVKQIKSLSPKEQESTEILSHFGQINAPMLERQIKGNLNYFKPGVKIVEQAIASIRGLIQLEQLQRNPPSENKLLDHQLLENKLIALAAGLGTAGVCAETSRYIIVPDNSLKIPLINLPVRPFLTSFTLSILVGLFSFVAIDRYLNNRTTKNRTTKK